MRITRRTLALTAAVSLLALALSGCFIDQLRQKYAVDLVVENQTWDEAGVSNVEQALDLLPRHVVNRLGNRYYGRLRILQNPGGISSDGWQPYENGANYYSNAHDRNELVLVPNQRTFTILHEIGHAYQMRETPSDRYAWVFFQTEMREFMEATGWQLLSSDAEVAAARSVRELRFTYSGVPVWDGLSNDDPVEDYANSFAQYFLDANQLRNLSPERYQFIHDHVATDSR
ncbi:MAG: hypothetical protein WEE64_04795 [Dehalococcoidia bacterium]